MAALDHSCICGHMWSDNQLNSQCGVCGSFDVTNHFDEHEEAEPAVGPIRSEIYEDMKARVSQ